MTKVLAALALTMMSVSGCASSALMVNSAPIGQYRADTITLEYMPAAIPVEDGTQSYLQQRMREAFLEGSNAPFKPGGQLTLRYQFVGHNEGSRVGRWLTAGLAGGSKSYIQAEFLNADKQVVGSVRAEGTVGGGFAGGSAKSGVDGAVKRITEYAILTFHR